MMCWKFKLCSLFIFCISHLVVFSVQEKPLQRGITERFQYAIFKGDLFFAIDGRRIQTAYAETEKHCLLMCVKNLQCFSTNIGVNSRHDGKVLCELLSSDKYSSPERFQQSSIFHHYSISSPCESFPCQHGGTCQALYEMDDYVCNCTEGYLGDYCEMFLPCGADLEWKLFDFSCYKYFSEALNWSDASSRCKEMNGSLVILHTAEEHEFVTRVVEPDKYMGWIGLRDIGTSRPSRDWRWEDGSALSYSRWHQGEPNGNGFENCVLTLNGLFHNMQWNSTWNDDRCTKRKPFICERSASVETRP